MNWSWLDLYDQTFWRGSFGARRIMCYISHVVSLQNQINVRRRPKPSVYRLSYAAAQMFLNMGGPTPVENMSQNGSSAMAQYCLMHRYVLFFTGGSESLICRIV